jgi:hypothetical protein
MTNFKNISSKNISLIDILALWFVKWELYIGVAWEKFAHLEFEIHEQNT